MIQVIIDSDENGNVAFFQDGRSLGAFTMPEPAELIAVLTQGGAQVTDLRPAEAAVNGASLVI